VRLRTATVLYLFLIGHEYRGPITLTARSKAWTVFPRSNAGIVGSNPTQGMDFSVRLFCVCVVLRVGSGLSTGRSPVQGVLPTVYRIKKVKKRPRSNKRTVDISWSFFYWWLSLQPPAHAGSSLADFSTLKYEAIRSFETSIHTSSTRRYIPEDGILHSHRCENLNSYINIQNYEYQNRYLCQRVYLQECNVNRVAFTEMTL
jgi:hypothetical protein